MCCYTNRNNNNKTTIAPEIKCGYRNSDDAVGREEKQIENKALFGEFPWMVAVFDAKKRYKCGGSLIHPSVVITAAQCVDQIDNYTVRAGDWDTSAKF